jgi:hypothetical protein
MRIRTSHVVPVGQVFGLAAHAEIQYIGGNQSQTGSPQIRLLAIGIQRLRREQAFHE